MLGQEEGEAPDGGGQLLGLEQTDEGIRRLHREPRRRLGDDGRPRAVGEVEDDRQAAKVGLVVGDPGIASGVGDPSGDLDRRSLHVRRAGEGRLVLRFAQMDRKSADVDERLKRSVLPENEGEGRKRVEG